MSEKKSRKQLRKEQQAAAEKEKMESNINLTQAEENILKKNQSSLQDLIAPSGIDCRHFDYLEIFSKVSRFARVFYVTTIPRQATFPYFLSGIYEFGDVNTSVFINPITENSSINDLNKTIVELESERVVANNRGDINRVSILTTKQAEAESLRDEIAAGYNKLFEATIICTLFAYNKT